MTRGRQLPLLPALLVAALAASFATAEPVDRKPSAAASGEPAAAEEVLPPLALVREVREARIALRRGEREEGLRRLRAAAEAHPRHVIPLAALLNLHREHPLPEDEAARLRGLLRTRLRDPDAALPRGTLDYLLFDPDASTEELELLLDAAERRLAAAAEPDPELLRTVATALARLERPEEVRTVLGRLLEVEPDWEVRWQAAMLDLNLRRWEDAAAGLERLMAGADDGDAPLLRLMYMKALAALGRFEELTRQIEHFEGQTDPYAAVVRSSLPDLLLEVAWALRDDGRPDDAEAVFERIIELVPDHVPARKALLHLYSDDAERAQHEQAIAATQQDADAPDQLAQEAATLLATGDAAGALPLLERVTAELPDSEVAWFNLGLAALQLERWEAAEAAFARATELNPRRGESRLHRGAALQRLGRCREALGELELALELRPDLAQAHYYLYACHKELGNGRAAAEHRSAYNESR
jgi:tetratricopeptide (TPR) repeat protein